MAPPGPAGPSSSSSSSPGLKRAAEDEGDQDVERVETRSDPTKRVAEDQTRGEVARRRMAGSEMDEDSSGVSPKRPTDTSQVPGEELE